MPIDPGPRPDRPSVIRKFLMWWFSTPASPWVSTNVAVDVTAALAYLERLNQQDGTRVSLQHLLCGAVGRTLRDFPMARARIRGHRILRDERVGVAMPVNLLGHAAGASRELSLLVVEDADRLALRAIADRTRKGVQSERKGDTQNPFFRRMIRLAERADGPLLHATLDAMDRATRNPVLEGQLRRMAPATTGLTNPGAALGDQEGVLFRGGAVNLPLRLIHVATLWGITPIQDEVIPVDGQPAVRPMLPVMFTFDHRLIDGVYAGRMLLRFTEILRNPEDSFGPEGGRTAG